VTTSPTEGVTGDHPQSSRLPPASSAGIPGGPDRALIVGTGLIGGSVGLALRQRGWHVSGVDAEAGVAARAVTLGALSVEGDDPDASLVVVATPVHDAGAVIADLLARTDRRPDAVLTDVGSVKSSLVAAVDHPFFIGGHPMAGSEQVGVDGASGDLFVGATWVLTPTALTDPLAYTRLRGRFGGRRGVAGARPT